MKVPGIIAAPTQRSTDSSDVEEEGAQTGYTAFGVSRDCPCHTGSVLLCEGYPEDGRGPVLRPTARSVRGEGMLSRREKRLAVLAAALAAALIVPRLWSAFKADEPALHDQARAEGAEERMRAITALGAAPSEKRDQLLLDALSDDDPRVTARAVHVIGKWTHRDSIPHLKRALRDPRPRVRAAAAVALGQFRRRDRVDAGSLVGLLSNRDEEDDVRAAAACSLGRLQSWNAMPALVDALEDPEPMVRGRAGSAVRKILGVDFGFRAEAPVRRRRAAVARIRNSWRGFERAHMAYVSRREETRP